MCQSHICWAPLLVSVRLSSDFSLSIDRNEGLGSGGCIECFRIQAGSWPIHSRVCRKEIRGALCAYVFMNEFYIYVGACMYVFMEVCAYYPCSIERK